MDMSSEDIGGVEFATVRWGGYDRDEVRRFIAQVAEGFVALEGDLAVSRRLERDCEARLRAALRKSDESSASFLLAADLKQKLLAEAEQRAEEILRAAHRDASSDDVEAAVGADLETLLDRHDPDRDPGDDHDDGVALATEATDETVPEDDATTDAGTRAGHEELLTSTREQLEAARRELDTVKTATAQVRDEADRSLAEARDRAESILAAARKEAEKIKEAGTSKVDRLVAAAREDAAELVASAEAAAEVRRKDASAESSSILRAAQLEAEKILEGARVRYRDAVERLQELNHRISDLENLAPGSEAGADDLDLLLEQADELSSAVGDAVAVEDEKPKTGPDSKVSRYTRRSARLPSLGKEANGVLDALGSLRPSPSDRRSQRRP